MSDTVGIKLVVDGEGALQSVGSIKKQLREATEQATKLNEQFGSASKEAIQAAKRVAELKDQIADAKSLTEAFSPDKKFAAFSQALSGVVGGFAAVQGAMALFGVESKEVEQTLLKVQAAMALSQGLNSVLDSIQSFKNLGAVLSQIGVIQKANAVANTLAANTMRLFGAATVQTGTAFQVLKTIIASTGIGLLIVGLASAVTALQSYANAADEAAEKQKKFNDSILEYANAGLKAELAEISRLERLAMAQAKSEEERANIQVSFSKLRIKAQQRYNEEAGHLDTEAKSKLRDAETDHQVKILEAKEKARQRDVAAAEKAHKEDLDRIKKEEEERKAFRESFDFRIKDGQLEEAAAELQAQAYLEMQHETEMNTWRLEVATQRARDEEAQAKARVEIAKKENAAKMDGLSSLSNSLGQFAQAAGEQTAAGKALAIASTVIDTYVSASRVFAAVSTIPTPAAPALAAIAAAATVVSGFARVAKIASVKIPGKGGGGGSAATGSSPSFSAPTIQNVNAPINTQPNQNGNIVLNPVVKAYVVSSEVTEAQERDLRIENSATFTLSKL